MNDTQSLASFVNEMEDLLLTVTPMERARVVAFFVKADAKE